MQRVICVCNTYFQLVTALQLNATLFSGDRMTVALSDHANGSDKVYERLKSRGILYKCVFIRTKGREKTQPTKADELKKVSSFITGKDDIWADLGDDVYDEMIYFNQRNSIYTLFARLYKKNHDLKVSRFEENILSYDDSSLESAPGTGKLRNMMGKKSLEECYDSFYCFYPELYKGSMKVVGIPKIEADGPLPELLKDIFALDLKPDAYSRKYIYFAGCFDDGSGLEKEENELIESLAARVGKDNLLIKAHPRDDASRFTKMGLTVDPNSNIPWEVIQLGMDFSQNVFLTLYSAGVLTISVIQENPPQVFFLFRLCDLTRSDTAVRIMKHLEGFVEDEFIAASALSVKIADDIEEII